MMQEYLHQGLIRKDEVMGRLTLKTGKGIPNNPPNSPLKVRVDAYIKGLVDMYRTSTGANKPQSENQKMPAMLIQTHKCEDYDRAMNGRGLAIWTDDEKTDDKLEKLVSSLETQQRVSPRKKQINETDGPLTEKPNKPDFVPKKILPRPKVASDHPTRQELIDIPDLEAVKKALEQPIKEIPMTGDKAQFEKSQESRPSIADPAPPIQQAIKSQAEDPKLVDEVVEFLKKGRWTEITPVHILAVSPIVRARIINYLHGQKVEVNTLLDRAVVMFQANRIVGQQSLPVREIEVEFPNGIKEMAILGWV